MLWGAGRLLKHAGTSAWSAIPTLLRKGLRQLSEADPRRVRRLAAAVLAMGVLVAGQPLIGRIADTPLVFRPQAIERAEDGRLRGASAIETPWRASVRVDGPVRAISLPRPPAAAKRTALIIGINRAKGGRPLPGSVTDATHMRDALVGYGFPKSNVTMLLEEEATRANIMSELAQLAARTPKDGVAVFAVATHTRRRGGTNEFLTADGLRVSAPELATALGKVRSKMWVALATCFAAGYDLPGITGPNRVVTFASSSSEPTYQLGSAGSYLVINMVQAAMLEGRAPGSVEAAFGHAYRTLERERPTRVPTMSDGVKGELVLGRMSEKVIERYRSARASRTDDERFFATPPKAPPPGAEPAAGTAGTTESAEQEAEGESSANKSNGGLGVCGRISWSCSNDQDD